MTSDQTLRRERRGEAYRASQLPSLDDPPRGDDREGSSRIFANRWT
jgi:hypothetical protein